MLTGDCRGWWVGGQQTFRVTGLLSKEGRAAWPCLEQLLLLGTVWMQEGRSVGMTKQPDFS